MSAAARICCDEVDNHAPALPWLLNFAASTIFTEEIKDTFVDQAPREELLSHYLLHEFQEIFHAYVNGVTHFKQKLMVTHNSCVKSSNWNAAAGAIMDLPQKIEMLAHADLNATGLITLKCEKPSAKVTQVKQVSHIPYLAGAKRKTAIYTSYYAFITILFNKRRNPSQVLRRRGTLNNNLTLTTHNAAPSRKQVSLRRIGMHILIQPFGGRCLRNGHSTRCADFTPQRTSLASMEFVESSTRAAEVLINPGRTCPLTNNPGCECG